MSFWKSVLLSTLVGAASVWAIKASPYLINSVQPDGSIVPVRLIGNERFHYTITGDDSVLVVRDSSGYWNYADEHGKKTGMRVHAKSKRGQKEKNFLEKRNSRDILDKFREKRLKKLREYEESQNASKPQMVSSSTPQKANDFGWSIGGGSTKNTNWPTCPVSGKVKKQGNVRGIVVLVQFSDVKFSRDDAHAEYTDFLNKEGYSNYHMNGSVRDFFIENSMGAYTPTFDVYGPITVSGKRSSYGANIDPYDMAKGAVNALKEVMDQLIAQGVDFSPYDTDGDKVVDFVYMIYAGIGAADTGDESTIWPHAYNLRKRLTSGYSMDRYACSAELDGQSYMYYRSRGKTSDVINGIGTFCHEFSHVLGLQDHYDVYSDQKSKSQALYTPNMWDLMDNGSYNCPSNIDYVTSCSPANLSAFERFTLGWLEPRRLEVSDTTVILKTIQENDALVLTSNNDNEYYFVDFRDMKGFDAGLPNKGMLIWHINYSYSAWAVNEVNTKNPMRLDLVEADGNANINTIKNDAFPTNRVNSFNGFVTWAGDSLGLEIYDIKLVDDHVEFKTRGSRVAPVDTRSSSSKAVVSSSSARVLSSSSSIAFSSADVVVSSSDSQVYSSSSEIAMSSAGHHWGFSSNSSNINPSLNSSSSEFSAINKNVLAGAAVRWSVTENVLTVNAKIEGRKTVRLFDVNGSLLLTKSFDGEFCEIRKDELRQDSFVVGSLELDGRTIKTMKVRLN